jgi:hypothetical protein
MRIANKMSASVSQRFIECELLKEKHLSVLKVKSTKTELTKQMNTVHDTSDYIFPSLATTQRNGTCEIKVKNINHVWSGIAHSV